MLAVSSRVAAAPIEAVIPAGQDQLLGAMLGRGEMFPGACRLSAGGARVGSIDATFSCADGKIVLELMHPSRAPSAAIHTEQFAIQVREGDPAPGFIDAFVARVRGHEAAFLWRLPEGRSGRFWRAAVQLNVCLFLVCGLLILFAYGAGAARYVRAHGCRQGLRVLPVETWAIVAVTALAAWMRFEWASLNLLDHGGIPYTRLLRGADGYWGTAQLFAPFFQLMARDIEHALALNRLVGVVTVPLVYGMCRCLLPDSRTLPLIAAGLFALHPLHILFSASDALAVPAIFLAASAYLSLAAAVDSPAQPDGVAMGLCVFAASALMLLTQVRQEHILFLAPAILVVIAHRRRWRARVAAPALLVIVGFLPLYLYAAASAGLRYQAPRQVWLNLATWGWESLVNPFLGVPVLLLGTAAVWMYRGSRQGLLAVLPWLAAGCLIAFTSTAGHHAARVYASWLILILPIAAYGITLLLAAPSPVAKVVAVVALMSSVVHPFVVRETLAARYLEVIEHEIFQALLIDLPAGVRWIVVPDDQSDTGQPTLEVLNKYQMILGAHAEVVGDVRLLPLSEALEPTNDGRCSSGACLFFAGLPCLGADVEPFSGDRCDELLRTRRTSIVHRREVVAAPFAKCSIYSGSWRRLLCEPALIPRHLVVYRIEG